MSAPAIVIGAGVSGLVAATYLARAGRRVTVIEARDAPGGACRNVPLGNGVAAPLCAHLLNALDPKVVRDLQLKKRGFALAARDVPLVGLRPDGKHVVIARDPRMTERNLALQSGSDAANWRAYRTQLFALGRAMRPLWWDRAAPAPPDALAHMARQGTGAFLDSWFESEALKATLAGDAFELSPLASGSALLLAWRAAQEMGGLQGVVAIPHGGPGALVEALVAASKDAGAEICTGEQVAEILAERGEVCGVRLASNATLAASLVFSSLDRRTTLLELAHGEGLGLGEWALLNEERPRAAAASLLFALAGLPRFSGIAVPAGARFVVADRWQNCAAAHASARAGIVPQDLLFEAVLPSVADPSLTPEGQHVMAVQVRPLPWQPADGWAHRKAELAARVLAELEPLMPGTASLVRDVRVLTPDQLPREVVHGASRLLASWPERVGTPVRGLYLCGSAAEPVSAISARAARLAVAIALAERAP